MSFDDATQAQVDAANPLVSTWLSANAGSGKTRVLTDRVARLLLRGTDPRNILCLTYTKAAAGEMQNRLFKGLGHWAMLSDTKLREALEQIGEDPPEDFTHARTLFARAVETPGGLKIQTIHSFCSALLRQFPLEAGVSPAFRELDEEGQRLVIDRVIDGMAESDSAILNPLARIYGGESLTALSQEIAQNRAAFRDPPNDNELRAQYGLDGGVTEDGAIASLSEHLQSPWWTDFLSALAAQSKSYASDAEMLRSIDPANPGQAGFEALRKVFLYANSTRPKLGTYPTRNHKTAVAAVDPFRQPLDDLIQAVSDVLDTVLALSSLERTKTLQAFANRFLTLYQAEKDRTGVLDFDDLIERARTLLSDRTLAWVLYRLDGRIDHILVDEAQDTSPAQWSVIGALAEEIASGQGVDRVEARSLFVVGDKKQSIYSFQGADARAFDRMAEHFKERMTPAMARRELLFSFRSSSAILDVVDATFREEAANALGKNIQHRAFHAQRPGRVDLWPLQPREDAVETPAWYDPVDRVSGGDPAVLLADRLAASIKEMLRTGTIQGENGKTRRIVAGDFLILVQRRSKLFDQIIRACKEADLPVAGADRLKISAALAVKDLIALLSFLALPEDDLSLAAALKSPLFGWSEQELFDIAARRDGQYLWQALRERGEQHPETAEVLDDLRKHADFERPYELLERILGRHEGRKRLVARLGAEAEDGIDELLAHALRYEQSNVPSLTGFLAQISSDDIEIKRAADTSSNLIRVMTVHGAKGLESPIVILPDTIRQESSRAGDFVITSDGTPIWNEPSAVAPNLVTLSKADLNRAEEEERQRLLYVAMTRAESWLIVAGVMPGRVSKAVQWHQRVETGLLKVGATWIGDDDTKILRYETGDWPTNAPADTHSDQKTANAEAPDFGPVPLLQESVETVAASDLGGEKALPGEGGMSSDLAMARGTSIHLLLEHLPEHPIEAWHGVAAQLLPEAVERDSLISEATRCIDAHPWVFAPETLTEVNLSADLPTLGKRLEGTIDRLILTEDKVTIVDYKTNAVVPKSAYETPDGLLRQMGAYLEAAKAIWPDREIELFILWTSDASLMEMPHDIVTDALTRASRP